MEKLTNILKTEAHVTGLLLRLTLFVVIFPHGCQLLLGWFDGYGFEGTMDYLTQVAGLPWVIALLVILLQFFGPLLLLAGFAARLLALSMIPLFLGMILTAHLDHGFFMNWYGSQAGEGYEYHLLVIGMAASLSASGAGKYSFDSWLSGNESCYGIADKQTTLLEGHLNI